jgi:hypothetical protein
MKKLLIPIATLAMLMLPAARAERCRASATGRYAKCSAPGAVPASHYVPKGKAKPKPAH